MKIHSNAHMSCWISKININLIKKSDSIKSITCKRCLKIGLEQTFNTLSTLYTPQEYGLFSNYMQRYWRQNYYLAVELYQQLKTLDDVEMNNPIFGNCSFFKILYK